VLFQYSDLADRFIGAKVCVTRRELVSFADAQTRQRNYWMMQNHARITAVAVIVVAYTAGCFGPAAPEPMATPTLDLRPVIEAAVATAFAPTPPPTPDVQSMVKASVDATLATATTPAPTYTPRPTPTPRSIYDPVPIPTIPPAPITVSTRIPPIPPITRVIIVQPPQARVTVLPTPTPVLPRPLQTVECGPNCTSDYEPVWGRVEWISAPTVSKNGVIELVARLDEDLDMGALGTVDGGKLSVTDSDSNLYGTIVAPSIPGRHWVPQPGLWIAEQFDYVANTLRVRAQIDPAAATHPGLRLCLWSGRSEGENSLLDCVRVQEP